MNDIVKRLRTEKLGFIPCEKVSIVLSLLEDAAKEIERLQNSINNCSTEEGLCYANELARKDAEIARLLQKYEKGWEAGYRAAVKSHDHHDSELSKSAFNKYPSLCWHCSKEEGFYDSPCKYCGAINPNVDLDGAMKQQETWNAC